MSALNKPKLTNIMIKIPEQKEYISEEKHLSTNLLVRHPSYNSSASSFNTPIGGGGYTPSYNSINGGHGGGGGQGGTSYIPTYTPQGQQINQNENNSNSISITQSITNSNTPKIKDDIVMAKIDLNDDPFAHAICDIPIPKPQITSPTNSINGNNNNIVMINNNNNNNNNNNKIKLKNNNSYNSNYNKKKNVNVIYHRNSSSLNNKINKNNTKYRNNNNNKNNKNNKNIHYTLKKKRSKSNHEYDEKYILKRRGYRIKKIIAHTLQGKVIQAIKKYDMKIVGIIKITNVN